MSVCLRVEAQNPSSYYEEIPRVFYGGLILGGNFSQVDGDNYARYHKAGLNAGGVVYAQFADHVAVSMELLYSQKGSKSKGPALSNSKAYEIRDYGIDLKYAEVPLMLNYFDRRKSHFGGGISIGQLITAKETVTTNDPAFPPQDTMDKYKFKKTDLSLVLGGSLHIYKGLFFNLRFQYSLLPIRKEVHPEFGRSQQFNNVWALRLMYLF
jgi:hypothetical protein